MNGPDHKCTAEQLLTRALKHPDSSDALVLVQAATAYATLANSATTHPAEESDTSAELTVYRASHESIVMGLYTTREAARAHCEADERATRRGGTDGLTFAWVPDDSDPMSPEELCVFAGPDDEDTTGYIVTSLAVAAEYDPEADA